MAGEALASQAALSDREAPRIRAFFALGLPDPQRAELSRHLDACAEVASDFRWASRDNLHLTLRFVGTVDQAVVEAIAGRLDGLAGRVFEVALGDVGVFRRGRLARVVWLGVSAGADALRGLAGRLEAECRAAGVEPETRPFTPHLTLARARPREGATLPQLPSPPVLNPWMAREVILFSSHLGKAGAVHEPIRAIRLSE